MTIAKRPLLYLGAAVCTGLAGILHLMLVSGSINSHLEYATFFLVSGVAQIFWVIPMAKKWGSMSMIYYWNSRDDCSSGLNRLRNC